METHNKFKFAIALFSVFVMLSCEKEGIGTKIEPIVAMNTDSVQTEVLKPFIVGKTTKYGKTIEELGIGSSKSRIGLLTTHNAWSPVTKENVRAVGISDNQVFDVIKNEYFRFYQPPGAECNCVTGYSVKTVGFGPTDDKKYGSRPNPFLAFPNYSASRWRFYGEGSVSQNTGFGLWTKNSKVVTRFMTNDLKVTQRMGGTPWFKDGKTIGYSFSVTGSLTVTAGGKMKIPFVAEGEASAEVSLGTTFSRETETSLEENFDFPQIDVPPGKSVRFVLEERWVPVTTTWKFPIQFQGNIAAELETVYTGFGGSTKRYENIRVNANSFDDNYNQPSKYHTMKVTERFSRENRIAIYKVDW